MHDGVVFAQQGEYLHALSIRTLWGGDPLSFTRGTLSVAPAVPGIAAELYGAHGGFVPPRVDGALLADGRQVEGSFEEVGDAKVRVKPTSGAPFVVPREQILDGARWCGERDLPTAGTALLDLAERVHPDQGEVEELAEQLQREFAQFLESTR